MSLKIVTLSIDDDYNSNCETKTISLHLADKRGRGKLAFLKHRNYRAGVDLAQQRIRGFDCLQIVGFSGLGVEDR
ncbi:hypothetical protein AVEN_75166-1, partial [Araneus ventricosus]